MLRASVIVIKPQPAAHPLPFEGGFGYNLPVVASINLVEIILQ